MDVAFRLFGKGKKAAEVEAVPPDAPHPKSEGSPSGPPAPVPESQPAISDEKLFDLNAVPAKEILRNKASVCPPLSAFCEILDNIFDNFEENGGKGTLRIEIEVETRASPGRIVIRENSGGVRKEKLEPLVRLGVPYHGAKGSIGTWGEGLKVAAFSLAKGVEIRTHFPGEEPVSVNFGQDWLSQPGWTVPVFAARTNPPPVGSTQFILTQPVREVSWSSTAAELSVIYGHKMIGLQALGAHVELSLRVNGDVTNIQPTPLASVDALRQRLAFPPDFYPRTFTASWDGPHGKVKASIIVGLTAHHSGDTSGVYLYGNGRLFARAQRNRMVGYSDGGKSILRDHPNCWRIHIYAFIDADDGADIPWQAPLKDGVSENHPVTAQLRDLIKKVVSSYARFAKIAKSSDLVLFTHEWNTKDEGGRAKLLFGFDDTASIDRLRALPAELKSFVPPERIEEIGVDTPAYEKLLEKLDRHSTYARVVLTKRDEGQVAQESVLRALNPRAFDHPTDGAKDGASSPPVVRVARTRRVSIELREVHLERLRESFEVDDDREALQQAVKFALEKLEKKGMRRA